MKIPVQCDRCGRKMAIESQPGRGRCVCGREVRIPSAIAAMPVTRIEPAAAVAAEDRAVQKCREAEGVLARVFPWLVSGLLHVALGLVMMLLVIMVAQKPQSPITVQSGYSDALVMRMADPERPNTHALDPARNAPPSQRLWKGPVAPDPGRPDKPQIRTILGPSLARTSEPSPSEGPIFRTGPPQRDRNDRSFPPRGLPADDTVFVIDRSGSMSDSFGYLCDQINREVTRLKAGQRFAVILFDSGAPIEFRKGLAAPTAEVRLALARFLFQVKPLGQTDPQPALKRAFAALRTDSSADRRQLVHLLTDGEFPDNAKAIRLVTALNAQRFVQVNTYLYGSRSGVAESTLKTIAAENHGEYHWIKAE
ncbi:MAG: vWA domain-containing protein [Planctomycetaceae bacterium]|nr:VWA domain-containing protein [Planctomycetaceae bacterium]